MGKLKGIIPLLVVLVIIFAAILIIENPFGIGDSSDDGVGGEPLVFDAPTQIPVAGDLPGQDGEQPTTPTDAPRRQVADGPKAPDVSGIAAWINSQPLMIAELMGKVVLVDFWTYTCVNCIRTFPYLKIWHSKYADDGLVILGVHAPEFNFEKRPENVRQAVKDYGIGWAVALDNDYSTWDAFGNRAWPAKYLIDQDGVIRYTHFGEGRYAETEEKIRELLNEAGAGLPRLGAEALADQLLDPSYLEDRSARVTPELYAGWERGYTSAQLGRAFVGQVDYYFDANKTTNYEIPDQLREHQIFLQGPWHNGPESLKHARETSDLEDYMVLRFSAKSANVVLNPEEEILEPFKVLVTLDGQHLTDSNKGEDIVIEEDGRSFLHVDEPRLYSLVQAERYGSYELRLSSNSPAFAVFAFTFGVYESGI